MTDHYSMVLRVTGDALGIASEYDRMILLQLTLSLPSIENSVDLRRGPMAPRRTGDNGQSFRYHKSRASALEIGVERSFVVPSDVSHIVAKGRAHTSVKNGLPGDAQLTISIATTKYDSRGPVHC